MSHGTQNEDRSGLDGSSGTREKGGTLEPSRALGAHSVCVSSHAQDKVPKMAGNTTWKPKGSWGVARGQEALGSLRLCF